MFDIIFFVAKSPGGFSGERKKRRK